MDTDKAAQVENSIVNKQKIFTDMENDLRKFTATHAFARQGMEDEVRKIVWKWLLPGNTLNGLYDNIFNDTVQRGSPSLLKRYEEINLHVFDEAKRIWADIVRRNNEDPLITESLVSALNEIRPGKITVPDKGDSLSLFDLSGIVNRKRVILTAGLGKHYWSSENFWGSKGNQPLDHHRVEALKNAYPDSWWANRILDEPWGLWDKVFSPDTISKQCVSSFRKSFGNVG